MRCLCAAVVFFTFSSIAPAQSDDKKSGQLLFNGKDLAGWTFRGGEKVAKKSKWKIVGGVALDPKTPTRLVGKTGLGILLNGGDGHGVDLITVAQHADC